MKKNCLFLITLVLGMMLEGCSKSENEGDNYPAFTLSKSEVEIMAHDTTEVIPSEPFTAWSEDEKVATVDAEGVIVGKSEGETDVVFKAIASGKESRCHTVVRWRYHFYEEPILYFDSTPEQIKQLETHELISEDTRAWIKLTYNYSQQPIPMRVIYRFDYGFGWSELKMILFEWNEDTNPFDDIKLQLDERYGDTEDRHPDYITGYRSYYIPDRYIFIIHRPEEFLYQLLY